MIGCHFINGSTKTYTDKELEKMANETVTYNGKQTSKYDASQIQRRMERQIRQDKKDIAGLQGSLLSNNKDLDIEKIKQELKQARVTMQLHNTALNSFIEQTGFRKNYSRLIIGKTGVTKDVNNAIIKPTQKKTIKLAKTFNLNNKVTINNLLDKLKIDINDYKLFGKYDPFDNNIQEQTAELLNFNKLPTILSNLEFNNTKGKEIVRVVHAYHGKTAEEAYQNTIKGKIQYSEGANSSYGRCIYFGDKSIQDKIISDYAKKDNKIINAKIAPNAKILEFKTELEYSKDMQRRLEKVPENLKELYNNEKSLLYMLDGIDGINLKWNNYYCIYNRGVLIIDE